MGRKTFEKALQLEEHPFKEKRCIVFSKNPIFKTARKNDVEIVNNIVEFVKELVKQDGKDIWLVGGSHIISILINANLVNEIILSIHPVILGSGIPLFKDIEKQINLKLLDSNPFKSGLIQMHYVR